MIQKIHRKCKSALATAWDCLCLLIAIAAFGWHEAEEEYDPYEPGSDARNRH